MMKPVAFRDIGRASSVVGTAKAVAHHHAVIHPTASLKLASHQLFCSKFRRGDHSYSPFSRARIRRISSFASSCDRSSTSRSSRSRVAGAVGPAGSEVGSGAKMKGRLAARSPGEGQLNVKRHSQMSKRSPMGRAIFEFENGELRST